MAVKVKAGTKISLDINFLLQNFQHYGHISCDECIFKGMVIIYTIREETLKLSTHYRAITFEILQSQTVNLNEMVVYFFSKQFGFRTQQLCEEYGKVVNKGNY